MIKFRSSKSTYLLLLTWMIFPCFCNAQKQAAKKEVFSGISKTNLYVSMLKNKKVGVVANQTSCFMTAKHPKKTVHLVDSLLALNVKVEKVFAPEHGFRGKADAGEVIKDGRV